MKIMVNCLFLIGFYISMWMNESFKMFVGKVIIAGGISKFTSKYYQLITICIPFHYVHLNFRPN